MGLAPSRAQVVRQIIAALTMSVALLSAPLVQPLPAYAAGSGDVSGSVFNDVNGNGARDGSDPGLTGRTVFVDYNANGALDGGEPSTTTSAFGTYSITGVDAATYPVVSVLAAGWVTTTPAANVNVPNGGVVSGVDFGVFQLGSIGGTVYGDTNGNGVKNAGESGVSGLSVYIDANSNGTFDGGEAQNVTNGSGVYSFTSLTAGPYLVRLSVPSGATQTNPDPSAINVQSGTSPSSVDFGLFSLGSISGSIYQDVNGNGSLDGGEPGYSGGTVFFDADADGVFDVGETSVSADGAGAYSFPSLTAGTYAVTVVLPTGFGATSATTVPRQILSGTYATGVDFGISDTGVLAGTVFEDTNSNTTRDGGEPGITGRTVFLDTNNDGVASVGEPTATTDSSGLWSIAGLSPGNYRPRVVVPSGTSQTTTSPGTVAVTAGAPGSSILFGLFTQGVISGTVFIDADGDGTVDAGDNGTAAKIVYIDINNNNSAGAGEPTASTDSLGNYSFTGLASGTYRIKVVVPSGSTLTTAVPSPIVVNSGTSAANVNFGLFTNGSITGLLFNDGNGNGTRDVGENVVASRTVFLDNNNNGLSDVGEPTAVSNASGVYTFSNLGAGGYRVRIVPPTGWIRTSALIPTITMTSGLTSTGNDIGLFTLGSISGTIYNDLNGNGVKTAGESGLVGRTVYVDANGNNTLDGGETTAVSGATGIYNFTGLTAGSYTIRLVVPSGQTQTTNNPNATNVVSGTSATNDFGLYLDASITGLVFDDSNGNAQLTAGEPGVTGVTVFLDTDSDGVLDAGEQSTVTNSSGLYSLGSLGPGSYRVRVVVPSGRAQTTTNPAPQSPTSGGTTSGINFGVFTHASIVGTVFDDTNGNGNIGAGEPSLANNVLYLDTNGNSAFDLGEASTSADAVGSYSFSGLTPGSYRVRIVIPSGWIQTSTNPAAIVPTSGSSTTVVGFGLFRYATLTGFVYNDVNGDTNNDSGESGLSGKTIFLDTNNNGTLNAGEATTLTDNSGNYTFVNLGVGTFRPRVVVPGDSVQTSTTPGARVSQSGVTLANNDFGLFVKATITGTVYNDVAGNGLRDLADGGIGSRTVFLDANNDGALNAGEISAVTTTAGSYTIGNVLPGAHLLRIVVPAGSAQTSPIFSPITPDSGSTTSNADFGLFTFASISGTVYNDTNGNGSKNSGEAGVSARTVYLDTDDDGTLDSGEPTATTNTSGAYSFLGLLDGAYKVRIVTPGGSMQTSANPATINAVSGTTSTANDFGMYVLSSIGGIVYDDANGNGSKATLEVGRAGITVYLDANQNATFDSGETSVVSNSNGDYLFTGLPVGSYRVRTSLPTGTVQTSTLLAAINATSASAAVNQNIGVFVQGILSGVVFSDNDGNGNFDSAELGVSGRTVFLDNNSSGTVNAGEPTTTTDSNGAYTFAGLGTGSFKVRLSLPTGTLQTTTSPAAITVTSGLNNNAINFGVFTGGIITGTVFMDADGNGSRDGNESASAGRTVYLDNDNDGIKDATEPNYLSNSTGTFTFSGLAAGTWRPRIVVPAGLTLTTDIPNPVVVISGTNETNVDFGFRATGSIPTTTTTTTTIPGSPGTSTPSTPRTDSTTRNAGYWMTNTEGDVFNYGDAANFGSASTFKPQSPVVGITPTIDGKGYWQVASDGGIFAFGNASFKGSMGGKPLNKPIVGIASTPSGGGYWMVATDGGIFAYGDAKFFGSTGSIKLNQPIVGMFPTSTGNGYWLVASDGGIFAYGDAKFFGSTGSIKLNKPIVGGAASAGDTGYWLVASDGGIFAFGSAKFYGSTGNIRLNSPIVSMRAPGDGLGYWMIAADGGIFAYGSARFYGSSPNTQSPIIN